MRVTSIAIALLCSFAVTPSTNAVYVPPNLPPGSVYQLIFATADSISGTSPDIATYNAFAQAEAALNLDLPKTTWHAVLSTDAVDARDNAPNAGVTVYDTSGRLLGSNIYAQGGGGPIKNQFGATNSGNGVVWTGSFNDGTESVDYQTPGPSGMGDFQTLYPPFSTEHMTGGPMISLNASGYWLTWRNWAGGGDRHLYPYGTALPFYALSSPITVHSCDYNGNGKCDAPDYVTYRKTLGQVGATLAADGNANGSIDGGDVTFWRSHFGYTAGSGSGQELAAAIPESSSLILILWAIVGVAACRRSHQRCGTSRPTSNAR